MVLHTKYQGSRPNGFRQEDFPFFSLYVKCDPRDMGHFWPQGHNFNKLGRGQLGDVSYQISRLYVLRFQTSFFPMFFPYISLCVMCDPWGGSIFGPRGIIETNLAEAR